MSQLLLQTLPQTLGLLSLWSLLNQQLASLLLLLLCIFIGLGWLRAGVEKLFFAAMLLGRQQIVQRIVGLPNDGLGDNGDDKNDAFSAPAQPSARPLDRPRVIARACCIHCFKTQDAANGDCIWCGTSLAISERIYEQPIDEQTTHEPTRYETDEHTIT